MKLILLIFLALFTYPTPRAIAKFCGNAVSHEKQRKWQIAQIRAEGCEEIVIVPLEDNYELIYGVKVDIGEIKE